MYKNYLCLKTTSVRVAKAAIETPTSYKTSLRRRACRSDSPSVATDGEPANKEGSSVADHSPNAMTVGEKIIFFEKKQNDKK